MGSFNFLVLQVLLFLVNISSRYKFVLYSHKTESCIHSNRVIILRIYLMCAKTKMLDLPNLASHCLKINCFVFKLCLKFTHDMLAGNNRTPLYRHKDASWTTIVDYHRGLR